MATQTKQILYSPVDIDDADFANIEDIDPQLEAENLEFDAFKSEMHDAQDDAKITVSKKMTDSRGRPMGRKSYECFECGIDDYTFSQLCSRIRDDFGTGIYKIQGRDSNGKFKFGKSVGIVAPEGKEVQNIGTDVGSLIDKFSDAMERQQMRTEQMFAKLAGPQTSGDAIDQMTKMMAAMGAMMGTMGVTPQQAAAPKTLVEQLTEFKMIKELFGGESNETLGGDANLYSLLGETVKAFGGPIATAIAAGSDSGELNKQGVMALPAPNEEMTEAQKMSQRETDQQKHDMAMKKNIHILIQNAKTKIPPKAFAGILVTNTPEDKQDELWDFISAEECVNTIIALEPAAGPYRHWFDELRIEVIELMAEPDKNLHDATEPSSIPAIDAVAGADPMTHDHPPEVISNPTIDS